MAGARPPVMDRFIEAVLLALLVYLPTSFAGVSVYRRAPAIVLGIVLATLLWLRDRQTPRPAATPRRIDGVTAMWLGYLALGTLFLLPLPAALVARLTVRTLGATGPAWFSLHPAPFKGVWTLLTVFTAMTAYTAVWTVYRTRGQITRLVGVLIGMGFFEAVYGLIQWAGDRRTIFGYMKRAYVDVATGTFINRNHYAAYLAMALCLAVAVAVDSVERSERRSGRRENTWDKAILTGFLLVLGLSAMFAAGSRAAPIAFLIAVGGVGFVFQRDKIPRRFWPAFALLSVVAVGFMAWLGVEPLNPRYADMGRELRVADARPHVYLTCLKIWADAPLLGTGLGAFADVFPLYRPPSILAFYDHAHSDYLETLVESGLVGFALLYGGVYWSLRQTVRELRQRASRFARSRTLGALAAVIAFGLHGVVEFNMAVPANMVTAFTLLGLARTCACRHLREARR